MKKKVALVKEKAPYSAREDSPLLALSEDFFQSTLDNLLEGCQILGFDWRYLYINTAAERHNRRANNELLGSRYMDAWPGIEKTDVFRIIQDCLENQISRKSEIKFIFPDGKEGWFDLRIQPVTQGVLILSIDITQRKLSEIELLNRETQFHNIANGGLALIWRSGVDKLCDYFNEPWFHFTGRTLEQEKGNGWAEGVHPEDLAHCIGIFNKAFDNRESFSMEYRLRHHSGEYRWILDMGTPNYDTYCDFIGYIGHCFDISEQKKAETAIRESEEKYRYLFANNPQPMWVYNLETLYFLEVNNAAINHYGYSREDFLKMTLKDIRPPEDLEALRLDLEKARRNYNPAGEWRHLKKNGELMIVSIVTHSITFNGHNARHVMVTDITERKKAEVALRVSKAHLDAALTSMTDSVLITDSKGKFTKFNEAFAIFHRFRNKSECSNQLNEYPGLIEAFLPNGEPAPFDMRPVPRALRGESVTSAEYLLRRKDSGESWFGSFSFGPIHGENGEIEGAVVVGRDITGQKQSENEIIKLNEELEKRIAKRTNQLLESNKELESFAYSVSHDLRAPLRHVIGFSEILESTLENNTNPEITRLIDKIRSSALKMSRLIDELLTYSRLGRTDLKKVLIAINPIIDDVISEASDILKNRNTEWRINRLPDVKADPTLLRLVIQNLINNSIKFTGNKEKAVIEMDYDERKKGEYTFYVKDNGAGFNMQYADKLFGVFQRLHGTDEFEGTGIGLATVRRIINRHNGSVWAEGIENEGATFFFTLPKQ